MKKIFIILLFLPVIIIYLLNIDKKEFVFKVGDNISLSINSYNINSYDQHLKDYLESIDKYEEYIVYGKGNYKIGELYRDIENNVLIDNRYIQNILIKADLVILEIGLDNLIPVLSNTDKSYIYSYLDGLIKNMELLIEKVKYYCKEKILLLGYYSRFSKDDIYIKYINDAYKSISKKYNIEFLDISNIDNRYFPNPDSPYLNDLGYKYINELIIDTIYKK